jgi:hypothetical protein
VRIGKSGLGVGGTQAHRVAGLMTCGTVSSVRSDALEECIAGIDVAVDVVSGDKPCWIKKRLQIKNYAAPEVGPSGSSTGKEEYYDGDDKHPPAEAQETPKLTIFRCQAVTRPKFHKVHTHLP